MVVLLWLQPRCYGETTDYLNYPAKVTWCLNSSKTSYLIPVKKEEREPCLEESTLYSVCHPQLETFLKLVFCIVLVKICCHYKIDVKRDLWNCHPSYQIFTLLCRKQSQPSQKISTQKCICLPFVLHQV